MIYEISKTVKIEAGHRVVGHKGKCANLHGHTYEIEIAVRDHALQSPGFVIDFGDISAVVKEWDHKMILWEEDPIRFGTDLSDDMQSYGMPVPVEDHAEPSLGVVRVPFNPTAENMARYLAGYFMQHHHIIWVCAVVHETESSEAVVELGDFYG